MKEGTTYNFDLEATPLQIKTDTATGSKKWLAVMLQNEDGVQRSVRVFFSNPIQYLIGSCGALTKFPVDLPTEQEKIWTITRTEKGVKYECNGLEVLDYDISGCPLWTSAWKDGRSTWEGNIVAIVRLPLDNASNYFRPKSGMLSMFVQHNVVGYL